MTATSGIAMANRYNKVAPFYDLIDRPMEWCGLQTWRRRITSQADGKVLEVGIGTGLNVKYYPPGITVTGIDPSEKMLRRAERRAAKAKCEVQLDRGNVENLPFSDHSFDTVVGTCVFCSVPDPLRGLAEIDRVLKPEGKVLLLEHVRPRTKIFGWLSDLFTPITKRLYGCSINRQTEETITTAGLDIVDIDKFNVWRVITARPSNPTEKHSKLRELSRKECLDLLKSAYLGRVGIPTPAHPIILPVNFIVDGESILFRTAEGTKLDSAIQNSYISFEADNVDWIYHSGWSVLVRGIAEEVIELDSFEHIPLQPWLRTASKHLVRIKPELITGRRIGQV